jgi:hypothetical protein
MRRGSPIDLSEVRRVRKWLATAKHIRPILSALESAPDINKKFQLLLAADQFKSLIRARLITRRRASWFLGNAVGPTVRKDESDQTIGEALSDGRPNTGPNKLV